MTSHQDTALKLEKVIEELNCTICNALIEDPHALACGHSFCGQCILTWLTTKKVCPMCRALVVRQPVHVGRLQNLVDLLRPENSIPEKRLQRSNWLELFPIDNNVTYIRDEDQDGVILRCSQCGWELDEENHCSQCDIHYDVHGHTVDAIEVSDTESHREPDEDLSDFIVDDDHVAYSSDNSGDEALRNIDRATYSSLSGADPTTAIEIDDEDDSDSEAVRFKRKRRPRILSEDEESDMHSDEDSNADVSITYGTDDEREEEEEEDIIQEISDDDGEDVEAGRKYFGQFVDDYAEEDFESDEDKPKKEKVDKILETITRAKDKMRKDVQEVNSSTDTSDDDDSDRADYDNLTISSPSKKEKASEVIPETPKKPEPVASTSTQKEPEEVPTDKSSSKKHKKRKNKSKNKKNKKKAKMN